MGLEKFNIAEDNKGGRKPKNKREDPKRSAEGEPYVGDHGEDFWRKIWHKFVEGTEATDSEMADMAEYTHSLPQTVKQNLHQYDIADYPEVIADLPGKSRTFSTTSTSSSGDEEESGLASVINAAK